MARKTGTCINKLNFSDAVHEMKRRLRRGKLHTICEEAKCPNIGECFGSGTATYLILGRVCTRNCRFCAVATGQPSEVDPNEPARLAESAQALRLTHVVITSVTRDDLHDGGAGHFAKTIAAVRNTLPHTTIEVLTPDFQGSCEAIRTVCEAAPDVFNHNLETVERLTQKIRDKAHYRRSLEVLAHARHRMRNGHVKSGLMLGLGEALPEVRIALRDIRSAGCDIVTLGQYLPPSRHAMPVVEYRTLSVFQTLEEEARSLGFTHVLSGPLVRSSYRAATVITPAKP